MSHKMSPLVIVGPDDKVTCTRNYSPLWAVMLVGRDTKNLVNMVPYMEDYTLPQATAKHYGTLGPASRITLQMPFLTNKRDLVAGDLLALPFDGGHASVCCEGFPPILRMSEL